MIFHLDIEDLVNGLFEGLILLFCNSVELLDAEFDLLSCHASVLVVAQVIRLWVVVLLWFHLLLGDKLDAQFLVELDQTFANVAYKIVVKLAVV